MHTYISMNKDFPAGMALTLVRMLTEAGHVVRATVQGIYSVQFGEHVLAGDWSHERPSDWNTGEGIAWANGATEYGAHPWDTLVLCGTEDRYGYAVERGLAVIRLCPELWNVSGQYPVSSSDKPEPYEAYAQLKAWLKDGTMPEPVDKTAPPTSA